jgi:aspartate kinase
VQLRVLKFGGSSLTGIDQIETAARRVAEAVSLGGHTVVVVSALAGVTNRLLSSARRLHPDPPGEELDRLLSTGESQAAALLCLALRQLGIPARSFGGGAAGLQTDDCFGRARIIKVHTAPLSAALQAGEIPVVAGFQGVTPDGRITTLGRGGSDITAVALAVAHMADRVVFFRDVDGVHSADPKLLSATLRLPRLDYESLIDLAEAGAPILHPQALETARAHRLTLEVRGVAEGSGATLICGEALPGTTPVWSVSLSHAISLLTVEELPQDVGVIAQLLALLDRTDLPLEGELVASDSRSLRLTLQLPDIEGPALHSQIADFLREERSVRFDLERQRRRVTLVGKGVASRRVSQAVERIGAQLGPPMATYHGERHRAFVVPERDGKLWLTGLHQALIRA